MNTLVQINDYDIIPLLDIGMPLSVNIKNLSIPIKSSFVGSKQNKHLLIDHPSPFESIQPMLFPENDIVLQCLHDGQAISFQTRIIETLYHPVDLVVLEYPAEYVLSKIRDHDRIFCALPVQLGHMGTTKSAVMVDISHSGCKIMADYDEPEKPFVIGDQQPFEIVLKFPGTNEEKTVIGIVRNRKVTKHQVAYGVQFHQISDDTRQMIREYIDAVQFLK